MRHSHMTTTSVSVLLSFVVAAVSVAGQSSPDYEQSCEGGVCELSRPIDRRHRTEEQPSNSTEYRIKSAGSLHSEAVLIPSRSVGRSFFGVRSVDRDRRIFGVRRVVDRLRQIVFRRASNRTACITRSRQSRLSRRVSK